MPDCYLLALCHSSSLDSATNNFSLFNLIEQVKVEKFPTPLPVETHAYWKFAQDKYEIEFEMRLLLVALSDGKMAAESGVLSLRSNTPRFRVRVMGLPPIKRPDYYELRVEWRRQGESDWSRCPSFWPLQVEQLQ